MSVIDIVQPGRESDGTDTRQDPTLRRLAGARWDGHWTGRGRTPDRTDIAASDGAPDGTDADLDDFPDLAHFMKCRLWTLLTGRDGRCNIGRGIGRAGHRTGGASDGRGAATSGGASDGRGAATSGGVRDRTGAATSGEASDGWAPYGMGAEWDRGRVIGGIAGRGWVRRLRGQVLQRRRAASLLGIAARRRVWSGYFFFPDAGWFTRALKSAPARNFGTDEAGT